MKIYFQQNHRLQYRLIEKYSILYSEFISKLPRCNIEDTITSQIEQIVFNQNLSTLMIDEVNDCSVDLKNISLKNLNEAQLEFILSLIYAYYFKSNKCLNQTNLFETYVQLKDQSFQIELKLSSHLIEILCKILSQIILRFDSQTTEIFFEIFFDEMKDFLNEANFKSLSINLLMWTSKALFVKNDAHFIPQIKLILQLINCDTSQLANSDILNLVDVLYSSEEFLLKPPTMALQPSNKFSEELHDILLIHYNQLSNDENLYHLLTHLRFIPKNLFDQHAGNYLIVIIKGLHVNQYVQINLISLMFLKNILKFNSTLIEGHLVTLVRNIISLANQSPKLQVRRLSLNCVCDIINIYEENELIKLKEEFVQNLKPTLSDRKRLVRFCAAKAYCKMVMLGQPGNRKRLSR